MTKPLIEQVAEAERTFRQAFKSKPRAGRTMRLHYEWTKLKVKLIAEEVRREKRVHRTTAPASAPIGHQEVEFASPLLMEGIHA